ncbi:cytochrome P450 [Methylobacterium radiodurans]|uniref:Cytochrome P450 n=1 Tax=Methylobacterium radiodurans TaxID=2202828 RepID=A0A2U8VSA7_9HYPH|nr:cytochrome P450 [Methylobacterium radiodurans]AWN36172.1 cytochrome P450 [Methylobacterium radiodurans]
MPYAGTFRVCQPGGLSYRDALAEAVALPALLATMLRSLIEAWPEQVYRQPLVTTRFLGQRTTFVCDPAHIRSLMVDQAASLARETFMMRALVPALGSGILTADGPHWRAQRRTAAPMFRPDRVQGFVPAMARAAQATRRRWEAGSPAGTVRDISAEMMRTTFDVIIATMISGDDQLAVEPFGRAVETYLGQTSWKVALSMLDAPDWVPHPGARAGARAATYLRGEVSRTIARRRARGEPGDDLLGLLLQARDPETDQPLGDTSLVDNLLTFVAAGHETTALVLAWTLRILAEHPEIERRVIEEASGLGVDPAADPAAVERLTYTRQVLLEVMRLYPPAPLIVRRAAADLRFGDITVPAGESVHVPVYALHRHRLLWDTPDVFDPDRFAPERAAGRDRYAYLPFGAGPRICIGMGLALTECLVILATLLPAFRFVPVRAEMPAAQFRVTLRPKGGIKMKVVPRHVR